MPTAPALPYHTLSSLTETPLSALGSLFPYTSNSTSSLALLLASEEAPLEDFPQLPVTDVPADVFDWAVVVFPPLGNKKRHHMRKMGMQRARLPTSIAVLTSRTHQRNQTGAVEFEKRLTLVRIAASI